MYLKCQPYLDLTVYSDNADGRGLFANEIYFDVVAPADCSAAFTITIWVNCEPYINIISLEGDWLGPAYVGKTMIPLGNPKWVIDNYVERTTATTTAAATAAATTSAANATTIAATTAETIVATTTASAFAVASSMLMLLSTLFL